MIDAASMLVRELGDAWAVTELVGDSIAAETLDPDTPSPAIVVSSMGTVDFTRTGIGHWTRELLNVECLAPTTTLLHRLVVEVSLVLPSLNGTFSEGVVVGVELGVSFPRRERDLVPAQFAKVIPVTLTCRDR